MRNSQSSSTALSRWVVSLSLVYSAIVLAIFLVQLVPSEGFTFVAGLLTAFVVLFVVFAYASWRKFRWGFLGAAIVSLAGLLSNIGDPTFPTLFSNTASANFIPIFTYVVATLLGLGYGAYGYYVTRRSALTPRMVPRASIPAIVAVGFAIGGLFIGALAAGTQLRLLSAAAPSDVTIVVGADNPANSEFYDPETLTVNVGREVVWFNGDPIAHTVTSTSATDLFDSGLMNSGAFYKHTFSQAGTFDYYCVYHTWMEGRVIVQAS